LYPKSIANSALRQFEQDDAVTLNCNEDLALPFEVRNLRHLRGSNVYGWRLLSPDAFNTHCHHATAKRFARPVTPFP
jgi:hypothetical protein